MIGPEPTPDWWEHVPRALWLEAYAEEQRRLVSRTPAKVAHSLYWDERLRILVDRADRLRHAFGDE